MIISLHTQQGGNYNFEDAIVSLGIKNLTRQTDFRMGNCYYH